MATNAITEFNKTNVDFLHKAIKEQINVILTGTGITLHQFRGTFYDYHYRISLELRITSESGETKETIDYRAYMPTKYHSWLGEAMLGPDGNTYEVIGYRRSAHKRPIMISRVDANIQRVCNIDFLDRCVLIED